MAIKIREPDLLAGIAATLCIALGVLSRQVLNPDGVSYLDLAAAMQRGDWLHFVQGYWSPLLALITGGFGAITGVRGPGLVPYAHYINILAALGAIYLIWSWDRKSRRAEGAGNATDSDFARALLVAFLLCSAGLPRIEAVTPDIILLLLTTWLSYELIAHRGERWLLVGALLGLAFLTKTSSWPWLVAAVPLRLWAARDHASRSRVMRSTIVCIVVMLCWVVPMSLKYGRPTLGTSGALNYSWYIAGHTSRLPDTDGGTNADFHDVGVGNGRLLTVAAFDDAAYWTYQPWGDPTGWSTKVLTETGRNPTAVELITYWLRQAARVFGLWLGPLLLLGVCPWIWLRYRPGMTRELFTTERESLVVSALGLLGLLQFVAVHAEPRLIAPFGMMLTIGLVRWSVAGKSTPVRNSGRAWLGQTLRWCGSVAVVAFTVFRFADAIESSQRLATVTTQLDEMRRRIAMVNDGPIPVAVVGPAAPIMASAFWVNAHIALQIAPAYAALVATLPKPEQDQLLLNLFRGKVPMIWRTSADGGMEMLVVPAN